MSIGKLDSLSMSSGRSAISRKMSFANDVESSIANLFEVTGHEHGHRSSTSPVDIFLESPAPGVTAEHTYLFDTPSPKTAITVRTHIIGSPLPSSPSPAFLAARRRERSKRIVKSIERLAERQDSEVFQVWTHETLTLTRQLIGYLDGAEQSSDTIREGNACEVLRQVRDSFLNGGWERYREKRVRDAVCQALKNLASEEEVTAKFADECMDLFLDLGLEPVATLQLPDEYEEEIAD